MNDLHPILSLVFLVIINVNHVISYSRGGPLRACQNLIPNHGSDKQYAAAPYEIRVSQGTNGNAIVSIVSTGDDPFAGFMLQARMANDREKIVHGKFSEDRQTQTRNCNGEVPNTLTHRSSTPKEKIETNWTPPRGFVGQIIFRASIVQSKTVFWTAQDSPVVQISTAKVNNNNNNNKGAFHDASNKIANDGPIESPQSSSNNQRISYESCGNKFCFGLPENCVSTKTCAVLLTGNQHPDGTTEFEIIADAANQRSRWWSMGLSTDNRMGDDSVTDCVLNSNSIVTLRNGVNLGHRNEPLAINEFHGVTPLVMTYKNGIVHCRWQRLRRSTIRGHQYDLLENRYHLLLAMGELRDDSDSGKAIHDEKLASDASVDLKQIGSVKGSSMEYLIKIHGSLMVIAWMGTVSIGIIFARYYKQVWVSKQICGVKVWFACHRALMVMSLIMMIIGMICIYYFVGGYRAGYHQICGTLSLIFGVMNPIGALFRPHPNARRRWIFNWAHWFGGNAGQILAIAAIFLAYNLTLAQLPEAFLWIMMVYVIFQVFTHSVLQMHSCVAKNKSKKTADITMADMRDNSTDNNSLSQPEDSPGSGFKRFFLGIYFVIINCIVIAIILCISLPKTTVNLK